MMPDQSLMFFCRTLYVSHAKTPRRPAEESSLAASRLCVSLLAIMYDFPLTGAQKSFLRGLGQKLEPALKLGKGGLTPAFFAELQKLLRAHELVKAS